MGLLSRFVSCTQLQICFCGLVNCLQFLRYRRNVLLCDRFVNGLDSLCFNVWTSFLIVGINRPQLVFGSFFFYLLVHCYQFSSYLLLSHHFNLALALHQFVIANLFNLVLHGAFHSYGLPRLLHLLELWLLFFVFDKRRALMLWNLQRLIQFFLEQGLCVLEWSWIVSIRWIVQWASALVSVLLCHGHGGQSSGFRLYDQTRLHLPQLIGLLHRCLKVLIDLFHFWLMNSRISCLELHVILLHRNFLIFIFSDLQLGLIHYFLIILIQIRCLGDSIIVQFLFERRLTLHCPNV